ncbi:hypothetical protein LCGC14_1110980 [marine sediment metagenome]|uniref:Large polyvalent protein associated domain-containing protein n=1 Tax=marine sediment metagenome TaxID=412755 RepID=A0A0F9PPT3_9ZZZZ
MVFPRFTDPTEFEDEFGFEQGGVLPSAAGPAVALPKPAGLMATPPITAALVAQVIKGISEKRFDIPGLGEVVGIAFLDPSQALEFFDITIPEGFQLKLIPGEGRGAFSISQIDPQGWELTQDDLFISPEGQMFTRAELEAQGLAEAEAPPLAPLPDFNELQRRQQELQQQIEAALTSGIPRTELVGQFEELAALQAQLDTASRGLGVQRTQLDEEVTNLIGDWRTRFASNPTEFFKVAEEIQAIFPGITDEQTRVLLGRLPQEARDLIETIWPDDFRAVVAGFDFGGDEKDMFFTALNEMGRTPDTEALLKLIFPGITDEQMVGAFGRTTATRVIENRAEERLGVTKGFWGDLGDIFVAGTGDLVAGIGSALKWLGVDGIGQTLFDSGQFMQVYTAPDEFGEFKWEQVFNPKWAITRLTRMAPILMALAVPAVGAYGLAGTAAARFGLGAWSRAILTGIGGAALSRPVESAIEAGSAYDAAINKGLSEIEARQAADKVFWNNMLLIGADIPQLLVAFAPTPTRVFGRLISGGLAKTAIVGGKLVVTGLTEGGEEIYQDILMRQALGEEIVWDAQMQEVFALGTMAGIGMGFGGHVITMVSNKVIPQLTPEQKIEFDNFKAEFIEQGLSDEAATSRAMDSLEATPELTKIIEEAATEVNQEITLGQIEPVTEADRVVVDQLKTKLDVEPVTLTPPTQEELAVIAKREEIRKAAPKVVAEQGIFNAGDKFTTPQGDVELDIWAASEKKWVVTQPDGTEIRMTVAELDTLTEPETGTWTKIPALEAEIAPTAEEVETPTPEATESINDLLEDTGRKSLGAAAALDDRQDLTARMWEAQKGKGFFKDEATVRQHVENLPDNEVRRLLGIFRRAESRDAYLRDYGLQAEIAKRAGTPKGYIEHPSNYKGSEEVNEAIANEFFIPIEDVALDVASTTYLKSGNFEDFVRLLPEVRELKLQALTDTALTNITEIEDTIAFIEEQLTTIESELSTAPPSRRINKQRFKDIDNYKRDIKNLTTLIRELRGGKQLSVFDASQLGIAMRETAGGKIVPALRDSGFYASKELVDSPYLQDINFGFGRAQDVISMFKSIDGGRAATFKDDYIGVAQKYILRPTERTDWAATQWVNDMQTRVYETYDKFGLSSLSKKEWAAFYSLVTEVSSVDASFKAKTLLGLPKIKAIVGEFSAEKKSNWVEAAQFTRALLDTIVGQENSTRTAMGRSLIGRLENYLPEVAERNIWSQIGMAQKTPDQVFQKPPLPDFIKPDAAFNKHAMAREGGMAGYILEKNVRKLLIDYIETAKRDIFFTPIIHNAKINTAAMRAKGFHNSARLIENWAAQVYAGQKVDIDKAFAGLPLGKASLKFTSWIRRNLTRAVFPLNVVWNMTIQPSSLAFTAARAGPINLLRGIDALFSKEAKAQVRASYSFMKKQSNQGKMAYQDLDAQVTRNLRWEGTIVDKVENAFNFLTNFIEEKVTAISIRAGYHQATRRGFTGRALLEEASDMGAVTQSMYNREGKPELLRAKIVANLFPFQTFLFQSFNFVRETIPFLNVRARAGGFETVAADSPTGKATLANRTKIWLSFIVSIMLINMVVEKATGRKPWVLSSFIPFFAILQGVTDPTNPWHYVLPAQYGDGFWKAFQSWMKYGDMSKFRKWLIRYHMLGGTQFNRIIDGTIALIQEEHHDVTGKPLFEVNPDEWFRALLFGPYATEGGQEFVDRMFDEGLFEEIFGIKLPTRLNIDNEIDLSRDKLGIVDEEGAVFDFGDLVSGLRMIRRSVGENRFNSSGNPIVVEFLKAEKFSEELEAILDGLSSEERLGMRDSWRKDNPEADAYLALFGFSGRIQSREAYNMVVEMASDLDITLTDVSSWLPPENVANSYFGYIDLLESGVSASSNDAMWFRLINPEFDEWGQDAYDWKPANEKLKETRPTDHVQRLLDMYEALRKPDGSADMEARKNLRYGDTALDAYMVNVSGYAQLPNRDYSLPFMTDKTKYLELQSSLWKSQQ